MAKSNKSEYQSIPGYEVLRKSGCNLSLKVFRKSEFFSKYGKDQLGRQAWFFYDVILKNSQTEDDWLYSETAEAMLHRTIG